MAVSDTKIIEDGWSREFRAYGGDMDAAEHEARAYVEGLEDGAPGEHEVEWIYGDDHITIEVREKGVKPEPGLYLWNWVGGGYNSCRAASREEALEKAREIAGDTVLKVDESTLRECTMNEIRAEERRWGPFD